MIETMVIAFILLSLIGAPVALALGMGVTVAILATTNFSVMTVAQKMVTGIDSFVLISVPLFMLTGTLMNQGGITERLFNLARAMVGHIRGGLGHVNILASMIFAGMSGSAVADAGGLGQVELKAMKDQGYPDDFSAAITCASSAIGPIIPPSIPMVIYAAIAEVSAGQLFLAGLVPGILMGLLLMAVVYLMSFRQEFPLDPRATLSQLRKVAKEALLPLLTPIIILGGIMSGVFTPTEASAVAVVYSCILGFLVYKTIRLSDVPEILIQTISTTAVVMFIVSASAGFSWMLIIGNAARDLTSALLAFTSDKTVILLILNLVMFVLGCLMENGVLLILLTPLFVPIAQAMGMDLVHFGLIMVLNLMIGVVTPPVGMSLFVVSKISGIRLERLSIAVLPFILPLIVALLMVTFIPQLSLWLPGLLMR